MIFTGNLIIIIYNKLWVTESQNIDCGPTEYYRKLSVIFKPIIRHEEAEIVNKENIMIN